MSQISETEAALMELLRTCQLPSGTAVQTGPHEWSGAYVQRLMTETPAVILVFAGGVPYAGEQSTSLSLKASWMAYCCVGWHGRDQEARRRAVDGGYDLVARVAPVIHNVTTLEDSARQRLPVPAVVSIENITDSAVDLSNLWITAVEIEIELPLDIPADCEGPLSDWLTWRGGIDIEGGKAKPATAEDAYTDADVPVGGDLEQ